MFLSVLFQPRPPKIEDPALLEDIAGGSSSALSELYERYGKLVFSLVMHVISDSGSAEEITQEVFLQVWNKAGTYQVGQGKVVSWLASIARHRAIDALRRRNARPEGHRLEWAEEDDEPDLVDPLGVEDQVDLSLRGAAIRRAIAQLPGEQRATLALAYFQGLTHQEIAETTGEPLGTIKTRIRLGMLKLRQLLDPL